jgi:hypothetical protein
LDKSHILKLALIIEMIALLGAAAAISRDYQDSWILEGLEIPFVLFVATYALAFFSEKRISLMVTLAVIGRCVFLLIPNLKYVWFQGVAIDQHLQYGLANYVYNEGYIATNGTGGVLVYSTTPFIHLILAVFSIVLNVQVVNSVKYVPILLSPIYPLLTYVIVKNLKFLQGTAALKCALFISSIPLSSVITGTQFGVLVAFLVLTSLVILLRKNDRRCWFIFIFFILVLAATHSSSSVLLTTFLLTTMLLQKVSHFRLKSYLKAPAVFAFTLICAAWLMFPARFTLESIVRVIFVGAPSGTAPELAQIPPRFFELARVDIFGAIKTVLVFHGIDAFLLLLTLFGLIIALKMRKQVNDDTLNFLLLISGLMLLLMPIAFLLQAGPGGGEGSRILYLASPIFPIFSGIFILYAGRRRVMMRAVMFLLIILLATLQLYGCQPLIPSANVLSKDLPTNEPIVYVTDVNSIYQRQMIKFASYHIGGQIACDRITLNQIIGLTEFNFSVANLKWYYPLDKNQLEIKYDCFLIHLPGASGAFDEQAEMRTRDLILEAIYNSSIIYTNGESYILAHNSPYP